MDGEKPKITTGGKGNTVPDLADWVGIAPHGSPSPRQAAGVGEGVLLSLCSLCKHCT